MKDITKMKLYCVVDQKVIPEERVVRRATTCCKDCKKVLRKFQRAMADKRKCRYCNKPSSPEDRKAFKAFRKAQNKHVDDKPAKVA